MSRLSSASLLGVLGLLLAGCCSNRCPPRCTPCCPPVAGQGEVVMVPGGPMVAAAPAPTVTSEVGRVRIVEAGGGSGVLVGPDGNRMTLRFEVAAGNVVVVGPDGKPMPLHLAPGGSGEVRVTQQDGKSIVVFSEGKEGEDDEEDEAKEGPEGAKPPAPAEPAATAPAPANDRGYIGFSPVPVAMLSAPQKAHWKVKADHGVVALRVFKGSPAAKAGLVDGDLIVSFAGQDMPSTSDLDPSKPEGMQAFAERFAKIGSSIRPGTAVKLVVERDGKPVTLEAIPVDLAAMTQIAAAAGEDDEDDEDGEADEGKEGPEKGEGAEKAPEKAPAPK